MYFLFFRRSQRQRNFSFFFFFISFINHPPLRHTYAIITYIHMHVKLTCCLSLCSHDRSFGVHWHIISRHSIKLSGIPGCNGKQLGPV